MFLFPMLAALDERWQRPSALTGLRPVKLPGLWILAILAYALLIGFRLEVGCDWRAYLMWLDRVARGGLIDALTDSDPGYKLLNWISSQLRWDIYGVNLIGGAVFTTGLAVFCRSLPRPWLALAVAVPYFVIVVSMGYSRQAIAIGFAMLGLVALGRKSYLWFVLWILLAATFHKSALIMLPIAALATARNLYLQLFLVGIVAVGMYLIFLQEDVDRYYSLYVERGYDSSGALIRSVMNALPAAILLIWRRRFLVTLIEGRLWLWFALISLALLPAVLMISGTAATDRIGLYMMPLQLVVFSHLPDVFGRPMRRNEGWVIVVLGYYAAVQFVWLNFASHAHCWIPYRFMLLYG